MPSINIQKNEKNNVEKTDENRNRNTEQQKANINKEIKVKQDNTRIYVQYWQNVLDNIKKNGRMTVYANLIGTKGVLLSDMIIGIEFQGKITDFVRKVIEEPENKSLIEKEVSMQQGSPMQIKIIEKNFSQKETNKKDEIESIASQMDLPFKIIDE